MPGKIWFSCHAKVFPDNVLETVANIGGTENLSQTFIDQVNVFH